jgi:hypothetical protein
MDIESLVNHVIDMMANDKSNDWKDEIEVLEVTTIAISRLRDRIDELGGYHDDI